MGKSFANFMCKKFFHPASYANIKRVWQAEERTKTEQQKQDDLRAEYEREQEIYDNRMTMGDEKVKHGLTFIYEPPKGMDKRDERQMDDSDFKLEWKRAVPREDESALNAPDQDMGASQEAVCIKCHQHGHMHSDKKCPMYGKASNDSENDDGDDSSGPSNEPTDLIGEMRRDGLAFKQSVLGRRNNTTAFNQQMVGSDHDEKDEIEVEAKFIKSLTKKQKKKLLKKLEKLKQGESGRQRNGGKHKKKSKKQKKDNKKKHKKGHPSSDSSSESDSSEDERRRLKDRKRRHRDSSSDSDSVDERQKDRQRRHKDTGREIPIKKSRRDESSDGYQHRESKGSKYGHREQNREADRHNDGQNGKQRHHSDYDRQGRDRDEKDRDGYGDRHRGRERQKRDGHRHKDGKSVEHSSSRHERDQEHRGRDRDDRSGVERKGEGRGRDEHVRDDRRESRDKHTNGDKMFLLSDKFEGFGSEQRSEKRSSHEKSNQ